jgi:hypothetical protein
VAGTNGELWKPEKGGSEARHLSDVTMQINVLDLEGEARLHSPVAKEPFSKAVAACAGRPRA